MTEAALSAPVAAPAVDRERLAAIGFVLPSFVIIAGGFALPLVLLLGVGIIDGPMRMSFTETGLIVAAVNIFLPFLSLPIYAIVAQLDSRYAEAAATLGASPVVTFVRVILPLTLPGIIAGVALVFSLSVSAYVVPTLLIGERYPTLATTIAKAYLLAREPGFGAAAGVVLLAIAIAVVALSARLSREPK